MPDPIRGANPIDALGVASAGQPGSPPAAAPAAQQSAVAPVDSADLARAEALLTAISQAASTVPPVDPIRVAELKQAINSGIYQANPQVIAQKIIEIEGLLYARGNGG